jgi:predicted aspartyl protease
MGRPLVTLAHDQRGWLSSGLNIYEYNAKDTTMEPEPVGRVLTEAKIENLKDLWAVEQGLRTLDQARSVTVADALVGTGATLLSLPTSLIQRLGLAKVSSKQVRSSLGVSEASLYEAVRLTIGGRSCTMDVVEVPDDVPVLIGQLPLEHLDFVVDLRSRSLIGNPAHGGEHVYELY